MGQSLAELLGEQEDLSVAALVDVHEPRELFGARYVGALSDLDATGIDVVVEFSSAASVVTSANWCAEHGVALVIGTTGLNDEQRHQVEAASAKTGIIMASNFSIGVVLQERFAKLAAPYFERVEIIELHHDHKADAPSGTSLSTAAAIAQSRADAGQPALVDQEVIFGGPGEGLTIRHDSFDRQSFVHGVALAVRAIDNTPGLMIGIDSLIT
jgi:4-hydroxy-tetrahydrodipicolinate reductase